MRVDDGLKTFGAKIMMFNFLCVSLEVKRKFYKIVVVPTVTHSSKTLGVIMDERHKLRVKDIMCFRRFRRMIRMCGGTRK